MARRRCRDFSGGAALLRGYAVNLTVPCRIALGQKNIRGMVGTIPRLVWAGKTGLHESFLRPDCSANIDPSQFHTFHTVLLGRSYCSRTPQGTPGISLVSRAVFLRCRSVCSGHMDGDDLPHQNGPLRVTTRLTRYAAERSALKSEADVIGRKAGPNPKRLVSAGKRSCLCARRNRRC